MVVCFRCGLVCIGVRVGVYQGGVVCFEVFSVWCCELVYVGVMLCMSEWLVCRGAFSFVLVLF